MPKKNKSRRQDDAYSDEEEAEELEGVPQASKRNVEVSITIYRFELWMKKTAY